VRAKVFMVFVSWLLGMAGWILCPDAPIGAQLDSFA
jgi:hypothetical protein